MKNNKIFNHPWVQFLLKVQIRLVFILFWALCFFGFVLLSHVSKYFEQQRSLSVCMWADKIDESVLQQFEKETGIKIYASYYESNEELVTKFEIAKDLRCDIILPSEYVVKTLSEKGFLKKIDRSRCNFVDRIYPEFMKMDFDPKNEYSLPIYWDLLGLGYTKSYFPEGLPSNSWSLIFDEKRVPCKQISMVDDAREAIFIANKYLEDDPAKLDTDKLVAITKLFITQKEWVGAYTDFQQGYFLQSKTYPLVVSQREQIVREMGLSDDIAFTIPDEGSLLMITNVVICANSDKDDLIYEFLNFIYAHESMMYNCKKYSILPTTRDVFEQLPQEYIGIDGLVPGQELFQRLQTFFNILTQKQVNDVWIAFKSF
ncbi:extracellular solute-binding protein [Candidatus Babeliales bacterium]|nr:extracellular solute-binding protein [Candidatus Babeliales bacterium]MBP9843817.1 extracellular solute-binding protein [Candidatus Babeliales bacterium]